MRVGDWNREAVILHYLYSHPHIGLLSVAGWEGAVRGDLHTFWAEHHLMAIDDDTWRSSARSSALGCATSCSKSRR